MTFSTKISLKFVSHLKSQEVGHHRRVGRGVKRLYSQDSIDYLVGSKAFYRNWFKKISEQNDSALIKPT